MQVISAVLLLSLAASSFGFLSVLYWYLFQGEELFQRVRSDVLVLVPFCNEEELAGFLSVQQHLKNELASPEQIMPCRSRPIPGGNPKVQAMGQNLPAIRRAIEKGARYVLIMDSNTAALPRHLEAMILETKKSNTGIVFSPVSACNPVSSSDSVDAAMVNTTVAKALIAASVFGFSYSMGKSLMIDTDKIDIGLALFSVDGYIAEDTALSRFSKKRGFKTRVSSIPIIQTYLDGTGYQSAFHRILRWSRILMTTCPAVFLIMPLDNALVQGVLSYFVARSHFPGSGVLAVAIGVIWLSYIFDAFCYHIMNHRGHLPMSTWLRKQTYCLAAWVLAPCSRSVVWRGNRIKLGIGGKIVA